MKITPVSPGYVATHLGDKNLYRVSACDDGNYGKSHTSVRIKPVRNLTVEDFNASLDNSNYGFIKVELDETV
jgi:hypothetical protein